MPRELKMQLSDSAVVSEDIQEGTESKNLIMLKVQIIIYVLTWNGMTNL